MCDVLVVPASASAAPNGDGAADGAALADAAGSALGGGTATTTGGATGSERHAAAASTAIETSLIRESYTPLCEERGPR